MLKSYTVNISVSNKSKYPILKLVIEAIAEWITLHQHFLVSSYVHWFHSLGYLVSSLWLSADLDLDRQKMWLKMEMYNSKVWMLSGPICPILYSLQKSTIFVTILIIQVKHA